jgi:LemA protein
MPRPQFRHHANWRHSLRRAAGLGILVLGLSTLPPPGLAQLPAGWQVTGFGRGAAATDQTIEYSAGRLTLKTGRSRSAVVYRSLSGDVSIQARFDEASGPNTAQIGLMMWAAVSETAGNLGLVMDPQGQKLTLLWDESSERAQFMADSITLDGIGLPVWLRLSKTGSLFQAAYSKDGAEWRPVGLPVKTFWAGSRPEVFAGLYANGDIQQRVSELRVLPGPKPEPSSLPADWNLEVRGQPNFAGTADFQNGRWSLQGVTTRGRGGAHNVTILQPVPNRIQVSAKIRLAELADPKAGGGLLFSAHGMEAGVMVHPSGGQLRVFTRRATDGRFIQNRITPLPPALIGQAEAGLRLSLSEGRVTVFHQAEADKWTQVGEILTVPELADEVRAGLELYSESGSRAVVRTSFTDWQTAAPPAPAVKPAPAPTPAAATVGTPRPAPQIQQPVPVPRRPPPEPELSWLGIAFRLFLFVAIVGGLLVIRPFNRLVKLRNQMRKGWAQIEVQLKRRHDLILNFVETVKGYAKHEQTTLEGVARARSAAANAHSVPDRAAAEAALNSTLPTLYAIAEKYPDLKANQNFMALQQSLTDTEDRIATARHAYNDEVANYNTAAESFPTNLVALVFRFKLGDFFEIKDAPERSASQVQM